MVSDLQPGPPVPSPAGPGVPVSVDRRFMEEALGLASEGRGTTSPNPMVGALVVSLSGGVVGRGFHRRAGEPHAEIHALETAGARARGGTLYCTLEPCSHSGRTGPCVERIVEAGVARVVAAVEDPNPLVRGRGFAYLRARGIDVVEGIGREAAVRLNAAFFTFVREGRPFVTLKVALSRDGYVAAAPGERTQLTSPPAIARVHRLRREVDAIGVGSGTVLADDPRLTVRGIARVRPTVRVVFDTRLRTPPTARLFSTLDAGPVIVVTTEVAASAAPARADALTAAGATLERLERRDLREAMARLAGRDVSSLLLEGGTELHRAAWDVGLVDRVVMYRTQHVIGPGGVPWLGSSDSVLDRLYDRRTEACGPDEIVEGDVHRID